jgi:hypothetical protein
VVGRGKSNAEVEATLSEALPRDDRFAVGDPEEDDGEPSTILLRLDGGRAEGGAGESTKNEPSPGDPSIDPAREVDGDWGTPIAREPKPGESTSIASLVAILALGESTGSVWLSVQSLSGMKTV